MINTNKQRKRHYNSKELYYPTVLRLSKKEVDFLNEIPRITKGHVISKSEAMRIGVGLLMDKYNYHQNKLGFKMKKLILEMIDWFDTNNLLIMSFLCCFDGVDRWISGSEGVLNCVCLAVLFIYLHKHHRKTPTITKFDDCTFDLKAPHIDLHQHGGITNYYQKENKNV